MKKILLSIAAVSAVAAAVPAVASAQAYGYDRGYEPGYERGHDRGDRQDYGRDRVARLDARIEQGLRSGGLTRNEAWRHTTCTGSSSPSQCIDERRISCRSITACNAWANASRRSTLAKANCACNRYASPCCTARWWYRIPACNGASG